jgi:hypothetical protein
MLTGRDAARGGSMAKLNGWKRVGIVVSILWILAAGIYTHGFAEKRDSDIHNTFVQECLAPPRMKEALYTDCIKGADDWALGAYRYEWIEAAGVAFVPVPLGWALVYLALLLARWTRRGFTKPF